MPPRQRRILAKTMLLIAAWPDNLVAPELIVWGLGRRLRRIQWYSRRVTECAYNAAVKELALPSDCDHFIFADRDMRPGPATEPFLQAEGELVACKFDVSNNKVWNDPILRAAGLPTCRTLLLFPSPLAGEGRVRGASAVPPDHDVAVQQKGPGDDPAALVPASARAGRHAAEKVRLPPLPRQGPRRRLHSRPRRLVRPRRR
jgi:hypothetical protein